MTIRHLNDRHYDWKHMIDYETFWILTFSLTTRHSGYLRFQLWFSGVGFLRCFRFPAPTLSRERDSRALRFASLRLHQSSVGV
jgi:hypothetical protein